MNCERGVGLILALLVLAFLTILGGALLTTATIDLRIGDNYSTSIQLLYLAEAGIEHARELLRASSASEPHLLDNVLLRDSAERVMGSYDVFLRPVHSNQALNLQSIARIGSHRKVIEATVLRVRNERSILAVATEIAGPIENIGSPAGYEAVVVNGDAELGTIAGYGILLVRGNLTVSGNFVWHGLILVKGNVDWSEDIGVVNGAFYATGDYKRDRVFDDAAAIEAADTLLPYSTISTREY